jgi:hypothetical protein
MRRTTFRAIRTAALVAGLLGAGSSYASSIQVFASLFGDPRPGNPDGLRIDVTITSDTTSSIATWVVDINSPTHSNAKLDEFYFNMDPAGSYGFSNALPSGWAVRTPADSQGGGNILPEFRFEAYSMNGGNGPNVTNSVNLEFTMTKTNGTFTYNDFFNAPQSCSTDTVLGCGRLGAHLQSLTVPAGTTGISDSGFLLGEYSRTPQEIPIPAAAWLLGAGLMSMGAIGRRRLSARV